MIPVIATYNLLLSIIILVLNYLILVIINMINTQVSIISDKKNYLDNLILSVLKKG